MIKQLQVNIETINLFGRFLSVAHGPTWCYCSSKPFFSLLLSSLTATAGAGEARFSGSAAPPPLAPIGPWAADRGGSRSHRSPAKEVLVAVSWDCSTYGQSWTN